MHRIRTTAAGCRYAPPEVLHQNPEAEEQPKASHRLRVVPSPKEMPVTSPSGESLRELLEPFKQQRRNETSATSDDDLPSAA